MSELNEKCGVFGIYGKGMDVSRLTFYGLFALQHRGQESSGIATSDGTAIQCYKNTGLVTHVYSESDIHRLSGHLAIGHNRYSTSKATGIAHAQPVVIGHRSTDSGPELALAHNGNLPSTIALENFLKSKNIPVADLNDSELMAHAISYFFKNGCTLKEAITTAYPLFTGAFSLVVMTKDSVAAIRDSYGMRPLAMAKLNGGIVFASETCAFATIGADFVREIEPGEMVIVTEGSIESVQIQPGTPKFDVFEFVYFARPDSELLGKSVYDVRHNFGTQLARETAITADLVVPVPETAIPVALGYSQATGMPLEMALVKNRYIHRTFIEPDPHSRDLGVKLKLTPLPNVLRGKRVVLVDDSIVRGTTSGQIVRSILDAGAKEVHFLVSSPPIKFPDFYGIDTPNQRNLIAATKNNEEIRQYIGAASLHYLSLQGMLTATGIDPLKFSTHCFTGEYPIDLRERTREVSAPSSPPEKLTPTLPLS
ncbi:MAG: amidophosphoribosyltransferase [Patescibacteria group bacterium]